MKEIQAKALLISHLLSIDPNYIVGSEMPFYYGERRADLIFMKDLTSSCIEIKTANDSLAKLSYQVEGYKKFFDYCYVACEPDNLENVRKILPKSVGIFLIKDGVKKIRLAKRYSRFSKEYLASYLAVRDLKKLTKSKEKASKYDLCKAVSKQLLLKDIYHISRKAMLKRYELPNTLLKNELGSVVTADDLYTLTKITSETHLKSISDNT